MFQKLLKQKTKTNRPERTKWIIFWLIAIFSSAIILHFINWTVAPPRSLLTQTDGLIQLSRIEDVSSRSPFEITLPTQTFNAQFYVAGVYSQSNDVFPTGTVSIVYARDSWRAFEIDYLPKRTIEEQRSLLSVYKQEDVALDNNVWATIFKRTSNPRCIDYEDEIPNKCEITTQLLFKHNEILVLISADGTNTTQGELIEIARSIINQKTTQ